MLSFFIHIFIILINYVINNHDNKNNIKYLKNNEVYRIRSLSNNLNFLVENNKLLLSDKQSPFLFIRKQSNIYYIETRRLRKRLGVDNYNNLILYNRKENNKKDELIWNIIKVKNNQYMIQNIYSGNFIEVNNSFLQCFNRHTVDILNNINNNSSESQINFIFTFLKLFEQAETKLENFTIIDKEPVDVFIKYIDLTDKNLKRDGIKQIYKDKDNEELRYSVRSILENIPWIRKIFILMPNEKVKFFKPINEIKEKIIYINDKDFLGFDSANIFAFTFNLYKLEIFGISKNFLYLEDDFFIGKPLKKTDFFYYDNKEKRVIPYLLTSHFSELNETSMIDEYNKLLEIKDKIHPQSGEGWGLSILCTEKFFMERYKPPIITTQFTHNLIAENIDDLKEVYNEIQYYKYINETLLSKERFILTLNQPHFVNLYQLNIKHKKVHSIPYRYIPIECINKIKLNMPLFVLNTGGNHIPSNRHYKIQKKIMEKRFPFPTIYEVINIDIKKSNLFNNLFIYNFF